jgi:hypothetical protein
LPLQGFVIDEPELLPHPLLSEKPTGLFLPSSPLELFLTNHLPQFSSKKPRNQFSLEMALANSFALSNYEAQWKGKSFFLIPFAQMSNLPDRISFQIAMPLTISQDNIQRDGRFWSFNQLSRGIKLSSAWGLDRFGLSFGLSMFANLALKNYQSMDSLSEPNFQKIEVNEAETMKEASLTYDAIVSWRFADFWLPMVSLGARNLPFFCQEQEVLSSSGVNRVKVCGGQVSSSEPSDLKVKPMDAYFSFSFLPRSSLFSKIFNLKLESMLHRLPLNYESTYYFDPKEPFQDGWSLSSLLYEDHPFDGRGAALGFGLSGPRIFAFGQIPLSFLLVKFDFGQRHIWTRSQRDVTNKVLIESYYLSMSLESVF